MTVCGYQKCLKYVVKIAFNNGWMPRNPFALYSYTVLNPDRSFLTEEELHRMMTTRLRYKSQDLIGTCSSSRALRVSVMLTCRR